VKTEQRQYYCSRPAWTKRCARLPTVQNVYTLVSFFVAIVQKAVVSMEISKHRLKVTSYPCECVLG